jgi:hypothetical protein
LLIVLRPQPWPRSSQPFLFSQFSFLSQIPIIAFGLTSLRFEILGTGFFSPADLSQHNVERSYASERERKSVYLRVVLVWASVSTMLICIKAKTLRIPTTPA